MPIRCEIHMARSLQAGEPADVVFALTNTGPEVLQILNWQTPFEGIKAPMFDIERDGDEVAYRGPMLKRGGPKPEDYFVLKPGERKQAKVDLADAWDVRARGRYTLAYAAELFDVIVGSEPAPRGLDALQAVPLECNSVTFVRTQ